MLVQSVMPSALSAAAEAAGDLRVADCSRLLELLRPTTGCATWTGRKTAPSSAAALHPRSWPACATSPPG